MLFGVFAIFSLVFTSIRSMDTNVPNICVLPGVPMFCNCDEPGRDEATYISCFVSTNITTDDEHWQGFRQQVNTKSLVFNSRSNAFLTYIPGKALRLLPQLQHVLFSEAVIPVLTSMSFSNLTSVRSINAENNEIVDLEPRAFAFLPQLLKLELSDNKIYRLSAEVFEDVPNLETLYLENNDLKYIDDGAFASLPNLKELDLFNNQIVYLGPRTLMGLDSLIRLDMSRNNLTSLGDDVFAGTPQLRDLELSQNRLTEISERAFDDLPYLLNLRLKDNLLTTLPDKIFLGAPNILSLLLTDNRLRAFPEIILETLNDRSEASFAVYIKGNPLQCSCDLMWVVEYSRTSKNKIFREEMRTLFCINEDNEKENAAGYLTSEDLDCSVPVSPKFATVASVHEDKTQNDPMSGGDDDDDEEEDDSDVDHDADHDIDMDDHSINVDDDDDHDSDSDEDEDYDADDRVMTSPRSSSTSKPMKNLVVHEEPVKKNDVSLSSKSQPSAIDGDEVSNLDDVPTDGSAILISSASTILCLVALTMG